jgi:membrane protease YdiL (CAAX protease family)
LGLSFGKLGWQLLFALIAAPVMFAAAAWVQLQLTRRRGALSVPAGAADAWFQAAFYALNGPIEEAFFRGLMQGGIAHLWGPAIGFAIATPVYVAYHRLGRWTWPDTLATALVGIPLGIAFWLLPGPASLVGVSLAHIAATCGFLGPGPYLLRKMRVI